MSLTRQAVEGVLIKRAGKWLTSAGLDGTTASGSNADLNDPIGFALRKVGVTVADISLVTDSEVADVPADRLDEFLDLAELRTLESVRGNFDNVSITLGPRREEFGQLLTAIDKAIEAKAARIEREYGATLQELSGGAIALDFTAKHSDDAESV